MFPEIFPGPLPPSSARYAVALNTDCQHLLRPTARQSKSGQKITRLISILRLQKAKPQDTTHLGLSPRCLQPQREFPAANAHAKGGPNQQSLAQNRSFSTSSILPRPVHQLCSLALVQASRLHCLGANGYGAMLLGGQSGCAAIAYTPAHFAS